MFIHARAVNAIEVLMSIHDGVQIESGPTDAIVFAKVYKTDDPIATEAFTWVLANNQADKGFDIERYDVLEGWAKPLKDRVATEAFQHGSVIIQLGIARTCATQV